MCRREVCVDTGLVNGVDTLRGAVFVLCNGRGGLLTGLSVSGLETAPRPALRSLIGELEVFTTLFPFSAAIIVQSTRIRSAEAEGTVVGKVLTAEGRVSLTAVASVLIIGKGIFS